MNRTLMLLSGLGLGAGLLYMLNSDREAQRRSQARAQLQAYRRWADDLLPTRRSLSRTTYSLGQTTHGLGQQARGLLARTHVPLLYERSQRQLRPAPAWQTGLSNSLVMLGCVGLGMGLMYLLDPNAGRRRRALVRDKAQAYWKDAGQVIEKKMRDTQHRARGMAIEARQRLRGQEVPADNVLEGRVRAQIGHVISNAGAIGVTAHQGRVSLSGPIAANEEKKLLSTVESVPGVTEVVNQLEVHQDPTHISGLQDGNASR